MPAEKLIVELAILGGIIVVRLALMTIWLWVDLGSAQFRRPLSIAWIVGIIALFILGRYAITLAKHLRPSSGRQS